MFKNLLHFDWTLACNSQCSPLLCVCVCVRINANCEIGNLKNKIKRQFPMEKRFKLFLKCIIPCPVGIPGHTKSDQASLALYLRAYYLQVSFWRQTL